jgi:hypothetical protein
VSETAFSWLTQKVPIWGMLVILALGGGVGAVGGQWHALTTVSDTDAKTEVIINEHIARLREDQLELTTELRSAVIALRVAIDKKVDVEAKKSLVDEVMRRLGNLEHRVEIQNDRFNSLLNNLRDGRPH